MKIDRFGINYSLNVMGEERTQSPMGGCLTLVALALSCFIVYFLGSDFFLKQNATFIVNEVVLENPKYVDLSTGNFPFMAQIKFTNAGFNLPGKGYRLQMLYGHWEKNGDESYRDECVSYFNNTVSCNESSAKRLDHYKDKDLSNWICLDFKKVEEQCKSQTKQADYKVELGGMLGDQTYKWLKINVINAVRNDQGGISHYEPADDFTETNNKFLYVEYSDYSFNNNLANKALKQVTLQQEYVLNREIQLAVWKNFNLVTLNDDIGWFNQDMQRSQSIFNQKERSETYSSQYFNREFRFFFQGVIVLNKKEREINRRWMKIQDVIALVSSFIKTIAAVIFLIVLNFSSERRDKLLMERLWKTNDLPKDKREVEEVKLDSIVSTVLVQKKRDELERPSFFDRLTSWCRKSIVAEESKELLKHTRTYIREKIDVIAIVQLYQNLEMLKDVLLTEDQKIEIENKKNFVTK